ncbi:hypothetical protein ACTJJ0_23640 [Chitinophaga sp. 22321]|uniref:6-bladed beta-propeller protein n=1 Tax=Chitinophaga hostae TaxID=2831022 RepID=A0ABS5J4Z9_9BACT|nr:hypothetical protein [Chitinophaga hostae]MBS0030254.1 hypothetical protein [Chitinophaga hostae]
MNGTLRTKSFLILTVISLFAFCKGGWDTEQHTVNGATIDRKSTLNIVDSFVLKDKVSGFNEYIPVALSDNKEQLLIMPARGAKTVIVYDMISRSISNKIDFGQYLNPLDSKEGMYNVALFHGNIYATYRNEILVYNIQSQKLINRFLCGKISGAYSAYNKMGIVYTDGGDTAMLSQLFSKDKPKYNSETDAVAELSPISLYLFRDKKYATCKLPDISSFSHKNMGQSSVFFDYNKEKNAGVMAVSPDTLLYFFSLKNHAISKDSVWSLRHLFNTTISGLERSNKAKDIIALTSQNPQITGMQMTSNGIFVSYAQGLDSAQYNKLYDYTVSTAERGKLFAQYRKCYLMVIGNDMSCRGSLPLQEEIEGISLPLDDTKFICKPKASAYFNQDSIKFYIAQYER